MNIAGDLLTSGDVLNPLLNAILVDTGEINSGATNNCYFNINLTLQCTVAGTFEVAIFDSNDNFQKSFKYTVVANDSKPLPLEKVPIPNNYKIKIRSGLAIIGTANVSMNIYSVGQD